MAFAPQRATRRAAYTLLEVLLAMAISLLLLGALYVAMNIQLRNEQVGRDVVEESGLARAVLNRLDRDITSSLGPLNPSLVSASTSSSSSGASSTATTGTTSATTGSSGGTGGSSGGGSGGGSGSSGPSSSTTFNIGVNGDSTSLTIYSIRAIRNFTTNGFTTDPNAATPLTDGSSPIAGSSAGDGQQIPHTDVRRISYELGSGDQAGLLRQESIVLAAYDLSTGQYVAEDSTADVQPQVIADEVDSLSFRYYDPQSGWVDSWPQAASAYDGTTPVGPPMAIEITIHITSPDKFGGGDAESGRTYRHVVSILTADAAPQTNTSGTTTTGQ